MDKWQSLHAFWNSFGLVAYDELTTFTKGQLPAFPHITYQSFGGRMGQVATLSASLWYKEDTWANIKRKADEILKYMTDREPLSIKIDNGFLWLKVPEYTPFAQPMGSEDDTKRIVLTIEAESLTNF